MNDLTVPLASGAIFAAATSYQETGSAIPSNIQPGLEQALASYVAPMLTQRASEMGFNLPVDKQYADAALTGALYYLYEKYMGNGANARSALMSAVSQYGAQFAFDSMGKKSQPSNVIGSVVPAFRPTPSRILG